MTQSPTRFNQSATDAVHSLRAYAEREHSAAEVEELNTLTPAAAWKAGFNTAIGVFDLITGEDPAVERTALEESDV